jgi:gliding motility-associated-like protein
MKFMCIKLFFRLILGIFFFIASYKIQSQNYVDFEFVVDGSHCASNGKAKVTIIVKPKEGYKIDISNATYMITGEQTVTTPSTNNTVELKPSNNYVVYVQKILYDGKNITQSAPFAVEHGLNITKAEYRRCSTLDVSVTVALVGGTGPYTCKLLDGNNVIKTETGQGREISFSAQTSSSNLKVEVSDDGCSKNNASLANLETSFNLEPPIIVGDKSVCTNEDIDLSIKSTYSGSNYQWKKGNTLISSKNTMHLSNVTDANAGEYIFSMTFDGCSDVYSEPFTIAVGGPPEPTILPAYICLNSGETSLSKYVSKTSSTYTLVWYNANGSLIGTTAPNFNPNLTGTTEYLVSQKNSTGCESSKAKLTVIVEELPVATGGSNIILCTSSDSKPQIRIVNAGNHTYNLYTEYTGGTKIGAGTAVNDTAIITTTQDLVFGSRYFLETQNIHGCVSDNRTTVRMEIQNSWILGPERICLGDNLSLSSDYAGDNIMWTKPDNSIYKGKTLSIGDVKFTDAGVYKLTVENSGLGCTMKDEIRIAVAQPVPPTVAVDSFRYFQDQPASTMTATPKTGCTLKWYNPDGALMSGQSPKPATDKMGVFVYSVSQDSLGCESPKVPVPVIVGTVPSAVPTSDINICIAEKPLIQINNTIKDYTYTVYYQNNVIAESKSNGTTLSLTSNVVIAEDTEIEITVADIYGVKSSPTKKSVTAVASLIVAPSVVCLGSDFQLVALDIIGASYAWTLPDGAKSDDKSVPVTNADGKNSGTYTLTVTMPGCPVISVRKSVNVTQPEPPEVSKKSYVFVENETATPLTATPKNGCILKWYNPEGVLLTVQSPVPATNKAGVSVYKVSQDSLGCESSKVEVTVIVGEVPESVPSSDINVCIADKPVIHISNTIQDYKYIVYYNNNVVAEGKGNGSSVTLTSSVSISENTELEIAVSDIYDISSERTKVNFISVNNLIDIQNSTSSVCDGSTWKLVAVDIIGASYVWTTLTSTVAERSLTIPNASVADTGTYILAVTTSGCSVAQQTIDLKVAKPTKPLTEKEIYYCTGDDAAQLTATALPGYKLVWFDESQRQISDAPMPNTALADTSIYYVLQISISDENCFSDREEITVVVEDKPEALLLERVTVCTVPSDTLPVSVRIPSSSKGYIYSLYSQYTGGTLVGYAASEGDGLPVDIIIKDGEIISGATYYLEITNKAGCVSDRTSIEIIMSEMTLSPDELPPYQVGEFYSQRFVTTVLEPQYKIVRGNLPAGFLLSSTGDISGMASEYGDPTIFTVEVSALGCSIQKEYTLKSELLVSKMFSPNGDGINDTFMKGYSVIIFDRIGRKLFSGDNGWDGTYNGKIMPEDVYYYILYYKDKDGKEGRITSHVTLIKTM